MFKRIFKYIKYLVWCLQYYQTPMNYQQFKYASWIGQMLEGQK